MGPSKPEEMDPLRRRYEDAQWRYLRAIQALPGAPPLARWVVMTADYELSRHD